MSPDVFHQMVDRLGEFVVPYQQALETEAVQHPMPLYLQVLVGQVAKRWGQPDGIIAFDPSSFPKRGTHSVGVKRQWCVHRGKIDNCQVGVFMGYVCEQDHAWLDFRLSLPEDWARDEPRRQECHVPKEVRYRYHYDLSRRGCPRESWKSRRYWNWRG